MCAHVHAEYGRATISKIEMGSWPYPLLHLPISRLKQYVVGRWREEGDLKSLTHSTYSILFLGVGNTNESAGFLPKGEVQKICTIV